MTIQGRADNYKVNILKEAQAGEYTDQYYTVRLKGDNTKSINIGYQALTLLIAYYEGKTIIVED